MVACGRNLKRGRNLKMRGRNLTSRFGPVAGRACGWLDLWLSDTFPFLQTQLCLRAERWAEAGP